MSGDTLIGRSAAFLRVLESIDVIAPLDVSVLILGETGTGKERVAQLLHDKSQRASRRMVAVNCSAIPDGLIESEFFGHERGSFTGASESRLGRIQAADGGTLFLDEVGDLPLDIQPKLLRTLQDGRFERLGSIHTLKSDFRLITATNRNLLPMIEQGTFRVDLYYRINVFPISLPPLRERRADIQLLTWHFVQLHAAKFRKQIEVIPSELQHFLDRQLWPGNIRELDSFILRCVIATTGATLKVPLHEQASIQMPERAGSTSFALRDAERDHIREVLHRTRGVIGGPYGAAAMLKVKRTTLNSKIRKLGIQKVRTPAA